MLKILREKIELYFVSICPPEKSSEFGLMVPNSYCDYLCCTDTVTPTRTQHTDTWQILKRTYDTRVGHVLDSTRLHDRIDRAT